MLVLIIASLLVVLKSSESPGCIVRYGQTVPLPLPVVRQPLGPAPLLQAIGLDLLLRPGVPGWRVSLEAGELLDLPQLLLAPPRRGPRD